MKYSQATKKWVQIWSIVSGLLNIGACIMMHDDFFIGCRIGNEHLWRWCNGMVCFFVVAGDRLNFRYTCAVLLIEQDVKKKPSRKPNTELKSGYFIGCGCNSDFGHIGVRHVTKSGRIWSPALDFKCSEGFAKKIPALVHKLITKFSIDAAIDHQCCQCQ